MQVRLKYGREDLIMEIPAEYDILRPQYNPGLPDERAALIQAMEAPITSAPLAKMLSPGDTVVIVHTDITRATPNDRIMPVLLSVIEAAGVSRGDITLLNGLGTHRPQTEAELRVLLGADIVANYRCLQHDCHDDENLISIGKTMHGHPVRVNRQYMEADVKILTGFIEPHFFAGFSGGPKAVLPALAGYESVFSNHGLHMIGHRQATWGITGGNPIWEEMRDVALRTEPDFLLNLALNAAGEITAIFAGDMLVAHEQGCAYVKRHAMAAVDDAYDIVITTNSGYPLDQNLYQAVKGLSAAAQIVRKGGAIIIAAACEDGLPDHGLYAKLLARAGSPREVLKMISAPGFSEQDQWQIQIQAEIQLDADVYVYSDGLSDRQIELALMKPCRDIEQTLAELLVQYGSTARVCVIPEGPQTIPYLRSEGQAQLADGSDKSG